jgi:hypothetical protein
MKRLTSIFLIICCFVQAYSQTKMIINKYAGNADSINLSDIKSITFKIVSVPITDLLAYYPFNGDTTDASGNGNTVHNYSAVFTTDRWNQTNRAVGFNGTSSYMQVSASTSLIDSGDITVCAWIKTSSLATQQCIFEKYYNGLQYHGWVLGLYHGIAIFDGRDGYTGALTLRGVDTVNIADNNWHFVVGQRQGIYWRIFVDGRLGNEQSINSTSTGSIEDGGKITIGAYSNVSPNGFWQGSIDDIRIYKRALTPSEISSLYHENGW